MQCDLERSCAKFAIVFMSVVPSLIGTGLFITILVMAIQKKPWNAYMFYVYYLMALLVMMGCAYFLYKRYPGIFCGFFIVYLISLMVQPIVNFAK